MFHLNIDVSRLILARLSLLDTVRLSELNKEYNQILQQYWIWTTRLHSDHPNYLNHKNLPLFNQELHKYKYIYQNHGKAYVLSYDDRRCYYDNIHDAYNKFRDCVIDACNLKPGEYSLSLFNSSRIKGDINLSNYSNNRDRTLLYISRNDAKIYNRNFLNLPDTLSAPYYVYEWRCIHTESVSKGWTTTTPLFELPTEFNTDDLITVESEDEKDICYKSYHQTNSGILKHDYPESTPYYG